MVLNLTHHRDTTRAAMQRVPDFKQDSFTILVPLVIPKAQFLKAMCVQKLCPIVVMLHLFRKAVLKAIQFNRQLCSGTIKVEEVATNLMLPTEFESGEATGLQGLPELFLLVGLIATQ